MAKNRTELKWLPDFVGLEAFDGDWEKFNEGIYEIFLNDFIRQRAMYNNLNVNVNRDLRNGKMGGFWHITSEKGEFDRCKRVRWPKALLANSTEPEILVWENERQKGRRNTLIMVHFESSEEFNYIVVLKNLKNHYFLVTAYPIESWRRANGFLKEYEAYMRETGQG